MFPGTMACVMLCSFFQQVFPILGLLIVFADADYCDILMIYVRVVNFNDLVIFSLL